MAKITLVFLVHAASVGSFPARAVIGDREVDVTVPGLTIELVSADGSMSQMLRVIPEDMEDALATFEPGTSITATYTAA